MRTGRRTVSLVLVVGLAAMALAVLWTPPLASAAPGEPNIPIENPDLDRACGLDVLVVLDESTSISISNATDDVQDAFRAFVGSLNNTGSSIAVEEFSTTARLPQIGGNPAGTYVTLDDSTLPGFESYIANAYAPNGYTNWQDAMRAGRYLAARPSPAIPHLVVFITDGDPSGVIRNDRVTYDPGNPSLPANEYENKIPLDNNEVQSNVNGSQALTPAISDANGIKSAGSHILAIGVGSALQNTQSVNRLVQVAGPDIYDGTGTFDISTHDVYLEPDFSQLEEALREAAFQLCAPSVSIHKLIDDTPDPDSFEDAIAGAGFEGEGTVTNMAADDFAWVLPVAADQTSTSAVAVTDAAGFATFQWTPDDPTVSSDFQLIETTDVPGYEPAQASCTFRTPDMDDSDLPFEVITNAGGDPIGISLEDIPPESIVTCLVINTATPDPSIAVEKYTNGVDADTATGPFIHVDDDVTWTYVVTNTGNLVLSDVEVTDNQGVIVTCPSDTLAQGQKMTCTAPTGSAEAGQYENLATVTAVDSYGNPVEDEDPSHYFGDDADVEIEKATNGADADQMVDQDGNLLAPLIPVGGNVEWTYVVSNPSHLLITDIAVVDSDVGPITCPATELAEGASMTCTPETSLAVTGAYENIATVTATDPATGDELTDVDPSHYFGYIYSVDIEKATNGNDADDPDGPDVPVLTAGGEVAWTYVVTNTGNVPLTYPDADGEWLIADDQIGSVSCPGAPETLEPGASFPCGATGTAIDTGAGEYANTGLVSAVADPGSLVVPDPPAELTDPVTDSDPSHYVGQTPGITIEKATNGDDADDPTGPYVVVGDPVQWTYVVTNTGTAALFDLVAHDYRVGGGVIQLTCEETALDAGESMGCDPIDGTSEAGQFGNSAGAHGRDQFGRPVTAVDPSHYFGAEEGIELEKYTNGVDADLPTGPHVEVGEEVTWTYVVHNSSNVAVENVVVTDDVLGMIDCPSATMAPGEFMTCTAAPGTAERGQHENVAEVTAEVVGPGDEVRDDDPSHYLGFVVDIEIEKSTNGEDADNPTGPLIPVGDTVSWTYVVTNPGDVAIRDVAVADDQGVTPNFVGGDTDGDDLLDPDETWTYEAADQAESGQYENIATVEGLGDFELGHAVSDTDPSHYLGVEEAIQIEKTPDQAEVPRGNPHTFVIEVTNIGATALTDVVVTDPTTPSCNREIGALAVDEVVTYECDVAAVFEAIDNTAFVEGISPNETVVTDEDDAQVIPVETGGTAEIGDTVWFDANANGVQDGGEPGIAGARVRILTISETVDQQSSGGSISLAIDETLTTDENGHYLQSSLVAGTYEVTLDLSTVDGNLTTPDSFVIPLNSGDSRLDADFGVFVENTAGGDLPFTGADVARLAGVALSFIAMGVGILLTVRYGQRVVGQLRS